MFRSSRLWWVLCFGLQACGGAQVEVDASSDAEGLDGGAEAGTDAGGRADARAAMDSGSDAPQPDHDAAPPEPVLRSYVFVGGYAGSGTAYPFRGFLLDRQSLALSPVGDAVDLGVNPTFIAPSPDGTHLYVANEADGEQAGIAVASVEPQTGQVRALEHVSAPGEGFVYTALSPDGRYVLAASYTGGYVSVYPVRDDGGLGSVQQTLQFGDGAQSHSVRVHPSGRWAFVPNKGLDAVAQLRFEPTTGTLSHNSQSGEPALFEAPSGPRHIALAPGGERAYVVQELSDGVRALSIDAQGRLQPLQQQPRLPADFEGDDAGAHVLLHPSGGSLYVSNRGSDTLTVYRVEQDGRLSLLEHEASRGARPRNFDIDARGEILVVANQGRGERAGTLAVFAIEEDGRLTPAGEPITGLPSPAAVSIVTFAL